MDLKIIILKIKDLKIKLKNNNKEISGGTL
jgi:hypothetical protein